MPTYLESYPPARRQFRDRYAEPTGLIVVHTAESGPDTTGPDTGVDGVADFIRRRADPGSYHDLADSDSWLQLVPYRFAAYGDGTGSNEYAIHISAATQAHRWPTLPDAWVEGCVDQLARAAAHAAAWLKDTHGITVPARRVTRIQSEAGAAGFISHGERDPGRRTDPGPAFPWALFLDRFIAYTQEDDAMTPAQAATLDQAAQDAKAAREAATKAVRMLDRQRGRQLAQTGRIRSDLTKLRDTAITAADLDRLEAGLDDLETILADEEAQA